MVRGDVDYPDGDDWIDYDLGGFYYILYQSPSWMAVGDA
jgi:hypothetical protein